MHWVDPVCLVEVRGRITRFLLNPAGEIDGLLLDGSRQIHVAPHLGRRLPRYVSVGERIRIRGIKPRDANVLDVVALITQAGRELVDQGPDMHPPSHPHAKGTSTETSGEVLLPLYGPKGELRGALLSNGVSLRMPPHTADVLAAYLQTGVYVQAWGHGVKTRHGQTLDVHEIAELVDET